MKEHEEETGQLTEQWREKHADIMTPDEEELRNQKEEEEKNLKKDRRKREAQDRRSEETGPTAKKQRTKDESAATQAQEMKTIHKKMEKQPKNNMNRMN